MIRYLITDSLPQFDIFIKLPLLMTELHKVGIAFRLPTEGFLQIESFRRNILKIIAVLDIIKILACNF